MSAVDVPWGPTAWPIPLMVLGFGGADPAQLGTTFVDAVIAQRAELAAEFNIYTPVLGFAGEDMPTHTPHPQTSS